MIINEIIKKAEENRIFVDNALTEELLSGVYGFFAVRKNCEYCFYIGKAICMCDRIFGSSNGHIYYYLNSIEGKYVKPSEKNLVDDIKHYLENNEKVELRLMEKVDMQEETYERAAHKLAFAEYSWIEKYQQQGQCLHQLPEGTESSRNYWENTLKKLNR